MTPAPLPAPPLEATDWFGVGLVLSIVGGFLLANSILFRHPRTLVEEHFGAGRARLASIRQYIFHRLQVHLGFLFLLLGFGLELFGHYRPPEAIPGRGAETWPAFPTAWVGVVLLAVVFLELFGWWLSHQLFRHHVRRHFQASPPDLERDMPLARELGELFGIQSDGDDTVQSYLERLRRAVGLEAPGRGAVPGAASSAGLLYADQELEEELG